MFSQFIANSFVYFFLTFRFVVFIPRVIHPFLHPLFPSVAVRLQLPIHQRGARSRLNPVDISDSASASRFRTPPAVYHVRTAREFIVRIDQSVDLVVVAVLSALHVFAIGLSAGYVPATLARGTRVNTTLTQKKLRMRFSKSIMEQCH